MKKFIEDSNQWDPGTVERIVQAIGSKTGTIETRKKFAETLLRRLSVEFPKAFGNAAYRSNIIEIKEITKDLIPRIRRVSRSLCKLDGLIGSTKIDTNYKTKIRLDSMPTALTGLTFEKIENFLEAVVERIVAVKIPDLPAESSRKPVPFKLALVTAETYIDVFGINPGKTKTGNSPFDRVCNQVEILTKTEGKIGSDIRLRAIELAASDREL